MTDNRGLGSRDLVRISRAEGLSWLVVVIGFLGFRGTIGQIILHETTVVAEPQASLEPKSYSFLQNEYIRPTTTTDPPLGFEFGFWAAKCTNYKPDFWAPNWGSVQASLQPYNRNPIIPMSTRPKS